MPLRVGAAGGFTHTALMSCKFFVDEPYRGLGLGLFMRFLKLGKRFPLLATTANVASGALFAQFGGYAIAGAEHTMLGVRRPAPLAEEWVHRRGGRPRLARTLALPLRIVRRRLARRPARGARGELIPLREAADLLELDPPRPAHSLTVVRDRAYMEWRYFGGETSAGVFRFQGPRVADQIVAVDTFRAGHRSQIRVLNVLDVWPPTTPESVTPMVAALADRYEPEFDVIWLRGQPPPVEDALRRSGWLRHDFPAPLAWCIDRAAVLPTRNWYLMPAQSE